MLETSGVASPPRHGATGAEVDQALLRRIFRNTVDLTLGKVTSVLLSGVTSVLLARYLGVQGFGNYSVIYAYLAFFVWLVTFGMENILIREVSQDRAKGDFLFSLGMTTAAFFALISVPLALAGTFLLGYSATLKWLILLAACEVLLLLPLQLVRYIFRVELRQGYVVAADLTCQGVRLVLTAGLAALGATLPWFIGARGAGGVVLTACLLIFARPLLRVRPRLDVRATLTLLRESWPLAAASLSVLIYHRVDQLMIYSLLGSDQAGLYATAVYIAEVFGLAPSILMASLLPVMCRYADPPARLSTLAQRTFRYLLVMILPVCLVVSLWSSDVLQLVYGAEFRAAGGPLAVLIWAEVWVFFGVVMRDLLIATGEQRSLAAATYIAALLNVGLNYLLIPLYGIVGAAWATLVSYGAAACFTFLCFPRTRPFALEGLRVLLRPAVIAGALFFLLLTLSLPLEVGMVGTVALYLGLLVASGLLTRDDWRLLLQALGR